MTKFLGLFTNKAFLDQVHNILMAVFGAATALGVTASNPILTGISALAFGITTISSTVNALRPGTPNAPSP